MEDTYIEDTNNKDAIDLILKYHYSHRLPSIPMIILTQYREEQAIACIVFNIPATRWSEPVLELGRLVRKEETNPKPILTKLISHGLKSCKEKGYDLVISYADSTFNHHGGIYQAASWNFHQLRKSQHDGWIIDGEFTPRRTCYSRWGASGEKLKEILKGHTLQKHYDKGKYLYWKSLNKLGKQKSERLKLQSMQYPKPDNY